MAYLDDIRQYDYLHWEMPLSVTVTIRRASGDTEIETDYAFRLDSTRARSAFGGVALANDERGWIVPANELLVDATQHALQQGDTIAEDDGTTWTITRVQTVRNDAQFVVAAVKNVE